MHYSDKKQNVKVIDRLWFVFIYLFIAFLQSTQDT
jgi:hypothetical protein